MDFLRRLHPKHAAGPAAARLELAPRWAAGGGAETARWQPAAAVPSDDRQDARNPREPARDTADAPGDAGVAVPSATTQPDRPAVRLDPPAWRQTASAGPAPPGARTGPMPPTREADGGTGSAAHRPAAFAAAPATPALHSAMRPTDVRDEAARATTPGPSGAERWPARLPAPLRMPSPQQPQRVPKPQPAPVVHVTIDRIDVRLPAPPTVGAPVRKPASASGVAPLADYLRKTGGRG